jgi:hypothetical protein
LADLKIGISFDASSMTFNSSSLSPVVAMTTGSFFCRAAFTKLGTASWYEKSITTSASSFTSFKSL